MKQEMKFEYGIFSERIATATQSMISGRPDALDVRGYGTLRDVLAAANKLIRDGVHAVRVRVVDPSICHVGYFQLIGSDVARAAQFARTNPRMSDEMLFARIAADDDEELYHAIVEHWHDPQGVSMYKYHNPSAYPNDEEDTHNA